MYICTYVLHVEFVHMLSQGVWVGYFKHRYSLLIYVLPQGGVGYLKDRYMGGVPQRQVQFTHVLPQGVWVGYLEDRYNLLMCYPRGYGWGFTTHVYMHVRIHSLQYGYVRMYVYM